MRHAIGAVVAVSLVAAMLACGAIPSVPGVGAQPTGMTDLWPDVPRMDGLTVATDYQLPIWMHLLLTAVTKQILGEGKDQGDWADFTTARTPDDVKTFYTPQIMVANGWEKSDKSTCVPGSDWGFPQVGMACFFIKHATGKDIGLMIVASQDDKTKQTNVPFIRTEVVPRTPTPAVQ